MSPGFGRSPRSVVVLGAAPAAVVVALAGLFPEGGWEPYPLRSFVASVAVIAGFLWALPARERLLRIGGVVYLGACTACVAVHTPVGANVERYGVLLGGSLLLCALRAPLRGEAKPLSAGTRALLGGRLCRPLLAAPKRGAGDGRAQRLLSRGYQL